MALTVYLEDQVSNSDLTIELYTGQLSDSLSKMAFEANLYEPLWYPLENKLDLASKLIDPLEKGINKLRASPYLYKKYAPKSSMDSYNTLTFFIGKYLKACKKYPHASVRIERG